MMVPGSVKGSWESQDIMGEVVAPPSRFSKNLMLRTLMEWYMDVKKNNLFKLLFLDCVSSDSARKNS